MTKDEKSIEFFFSLTKAFFDQEERIRAPHQSSMFVSLSDSFVCGLGPRCFGFEVYFYVYRREDTAGFVCVLSLLRGWRWFEFGTLSIFIFTSLTFDCVSERLVTVCMNMGYR